jgi:hypothetical protein
VPPRGLLSGVPARTVPAIAATLRRKESAALVSRIYSVSAAKGTYLNGVRGGLVPGGGNQRQARAFIRPQGVFWNAEGHEIMSEEFATVLEAMRRAQAELAAYLSARDQDAELTIAKLVGILDRREVVGATRLLHALHNAPPAAEIG